MYNVKFETLKKNTKQVFNNTPGLGIQALIQSMDSTKSWRETLPELKEIGFNLIDKWDVRCVNQLIEIFPGILPRKYHNKPITIYMADNENMDWMVSIE